MRDEPGKDLTLPGQPHAPVPGGLSAAFAAALLPHAPPSQAVQPPPGSWPPCNHRTAGRQPGPGAPGMPQEEPA